MEALHQKLQMELEGAQSNKQRLEADNLALYSKIRYLQSYTAGGSSSSSPMMMSPKVRVLCSAIASGDMIVMPRL